MTMLLFSVLNDIHTLNDLVIWGGYGLLFAIIFAETGLFAGFFLPGDSLLITAGLIAASGRLDIVMVIVTLSMGAILGDTTGYFIGRRLQKTIFSRKETLFFHPEHLDKTRQFYERHGSKAVFLARFVPVVRSFATTLAGVSAMPFPVFILFSFSGAVIWVSIFTLIGYFVASAFPHAVEYFHYAILAGIVLILGGAIKNLRRTRSR
jgi:membrane-associated protein